MLNITMAVLRDGYRAINELGAVCYEDVSDHLPEEFRRKARISAGNFQNLAEFRALLSPAWGGVAFAWWSHKVLRWLTPHLLLGLLAATLGLVALGAGWFYQLALAGQLGLPMLLLLDAALGRRGLHGRLWPCNPNMVSIQIEADLLLVAVHGGHRQGHQVFLDRDRSVVLRVVDRAGGARASQPVGIGVESSRYCDLSA